MPRQIPVPQEFLCRPVTVAKAVAAGVSRSVLDGPRFRRAFHGVRVPIGLPDTVAVRAAAAALIVPEPFAFCGPTAAQLCGLPLPVALQECSDTHVLVPTAARVPRHRSVPGWILRGHSGLRLDDVGRLGGFPVLGVAPLFVQLAADVGLHDLVALGDAMVRRWIGGIDLAAVIQRAHSRRGVRRARQAVDLVRPRVDSPMETRVRLMVVDAGLPCPITGYVVHDHSGWIGEVDLAYPEWKIAIEYDGDVHRTRRAWAADHAKTQLLLDAGWVVIRLTARDVLHTPALTIHRLRQHIKAATRRA